MNNFINERSTLEVQYDRKRTITEQLQLARTHETFVVYTIVN